MNYEFKKDDVYRFANAVGIEGKVKNGNFHLKTCPYCKGGRDGKDKGTFAISMTDGRFKCLRSSCGITGNMITLHTDFPQFSLGSDLDEYYRPQKKYRELAQPKAHIVPKPKAIEYLESRGISAEIADKYEITTKKDADNILVFPFFDEEGILKFVKYRKTDYEKGVDKAKEWCEAECEPILFGMKQCSDKFRTLVITEGQVDSLSVATAFSGNIDVVSVPTGAKGFTWVPYCWDWLSRWQEIVVFGDYEHGSISLLAELKKRFRGRVKHIRERDYKDCKDANELLLKYGAEYVRRCVENAVDVPVKRVMKLSAVQNVDVFKIPKLKTGIKKLDNLLYGGLPIGYLHILAGVRGKGKSTFGSQLLAQALEQGYKVFAYSGELTNGNFKSWLDFQIAGKRNVVENIGIDGVPYRFITNTNMDIINNWYDDNAFIYDNSQVDDEKEDLIATIEEVICKYGVQVILLDNLMTAIEIDSSNEETNRKQTKIANKLAKLALKYEVMIILVAHKRKDGYNKSMDENDNVSGTANITNLAGIVLNYDEDKFAESEFDRKLVVSKNRLFGKLCLDGIPLHFEERSKRIYNTKEEVEYEFSCFPMSDYYNSEQVGIADTPFE